MFEVKQSTALDILFFAHDANGDAVTGKADGDFTKRISKNAAAFAAMTVTITERENGWYHLQLSTTHTDTLGVLTLTFTATGIKQVNLQFRVAARITDDLATSSALATVQADTDDIQSRLPAALVSGRIDASVGAMAADVVTAAAIANGAIDAATFAAGAINAAAIATDAIDADAIAAGAIDAAAIATGAIDADALAADVQTKLRAIVSGTADSGSTTTMVDAARTEADTDYWKGDLILFTSGNLAGQVRLITGFTPASDTITFAPATTQAVGTHTYEIIPAGRADLQLWLGTVVNALISGRVDANAQVVGDKTGYSLTQAFPTNFSALSITAGGLVDITQAAADKIWASTTRTLTSFGTLVADIWSNGTRTLTGFSTALAVAVWDVLDSAIGTASSIGLRLKTNVDAAITTRAAPGDAMDLVVDSVDSVALAASGTAEIADRLLGRNIAGGSDGGRTVTSAFRKIRNRVAIAGGTMTVYQEDDAATDHTAAVTTAAGNPITEVDPS